MPGRKPKNNALKLLEGNRGKRPLRNVASVAGDFEPPFQLGEIARKEWDRIRAEAKWIQAPSAWVLAERCVAVQDLQTAREDIQARGLLVTTRNGDVKNPSLQIIREARQFILRADTELGLTAISQQKVDAPVSAALDPIEAALCG